MTMEEEYRMSGRGRVAWAVALAVVPVLGIGAVFGLTDDTLVRGERSPLAQQYAAVTDEPPARTELPLANRFGRPAGASTLVLYDAGGTGSADATEAADAADAEMYAVATANLATHFGEAEIVAMDDYAAGTMDRFDAVVYLGTDYETTLPPAFLTDVRDGDVPVMWVEANIEQLAGAMPGPTGFTDRYGWDPLDLVEVPGDLVETVDYKNHDVRRAPESSEVLVSPAVVDSETVDVLAGYTCRHHGVAVPCSAEDPGRSTELPWAVRSENLTYLAEVPLNYIDVNDVYLVFADLFYDLLAPDTPPVRQAAVRLEDVGPEADPEDLRAVADYLYAQHVPFQVAVIPIQVARTPGKDDFYGLSLLDTPEVVKALKYMQERGGTLIQHGTTHQFGNYDNPYSGRTGEDYEFYRYGCTENEEPPLRFEPCATDSFVSMIGPVEEDSVEEHTSRLLKGRQVMIDAGLGTPTVFETPHYAASVNAYLAMSKIYDARYEQGQYYPGIVSGVAGPQSRAFGQQFPYTVHDIYGSTVYPENLLNITEKEQNHHSIRPPEFIVARAKDALVVRESTASFYFHPYLKLDYLRRAVEGIRDLGYTFVPVQELR